MNWISVKDSLPEYIKGEPYKRCFMVGKSHKDYAIYYIGKYCANMNRWDIESKFNTRPCVPNYKTVNGINSVTRCTDCYKDPLHEKSVIEFWMYIIEPPAELNDKKWVFTWKDD